MTKIARLLAILLISAGVISMGSLSIGAVATHPSDSEPGNPPVAEEESAASVTCLPFGLYGTITADVLAARLSDSSDNLTFVGTSNGLYVLGPDGKLRHFLYSPFGIGHFTLIDDITGDGIREIVVALDDTQVPAIRCYDGATWEKLWQFAPMARIWDRLWVERQLPITSLEAIDVGDSQSVVVTSGQRVFSVDAKNGKVNWRFGTSSAVARMTTTGDINGDGADEVFAGSADGHLFLLKGKTGDVRWQTMLPASSANSGDPTMVNDILTLDKEAGRVAVVSTDGLMRLFDLQNRACEWAVPVSEDKVAGWRIALAPNVTPDGLPGILVNYASSYTNAADEEGVVLFDGSGEKQWDKKLYVYHDIGVEVGSFGNKPVILEPREQEIRLIDLDDGETVVKTIPASTLDGQAPMVRQVGETSFLLASSSSDLAVVSASGETLWNFPRLTSVKAKDGHFVGDTTEDTLFSCEFTTSAQYGYSPPVNNDGLTIGTTGATYQTQQAEPEVRSLKARDGATGEIAWSYEVPATDLKSSGGLKGIRVTPDLVGSDNIQDIIGYREDTVFVFSGKNGTWTSFGVGQPVASLHVIRNGPSGNAIAVGTADGLMIFDSSGTEIWTTTSAEWTEDETVKFAVLDDVNSDNVSDLAVLSAGEIVLLKSTAGVAAYQPHLTFKAETGSSIEYVELVPDANRDGVRDVAYIQRAAGNQQPGQQYTPPGCPLLMERSPVDGKELLRVVLPSSHPNIDLACGDFDGDGCADSLICYISSDTCGTVSSGPTQNFHTELLVISGKNGATLWTHDMRSMSYSWSGWGTRPPAIVVGDVNGDGKDDLAWTNDYYGNQEYSGSYCLQQRVEIYDISQDTPLKEIPANPLLSQDTYRYRTSGDGSALDAYVGADGHRLVVIRSTEPWLPNYNPDATGGSVSGSYLAVLDAEKGQRLAAFAGLDPTSASLFETHQPGVTGVAAFGGVYFLRLNSGLQLTSPDNGAKTGPGVSIRWDGTTAGDFTQVFVDGVRNDMGYDSQADLYLARGDHDIVVRSIDEYGRIFYSPSDLGSPLTITVTPSPWKPALLVLSLFVLLGMLVLLFYARLHRIWRARKRKASP